MTAIALPRPRNTCAWLELERLRTIKLGIAARGAVGVGLARQQGGAAPGVDWSQWFEHAWSPLGAASQSASYSDLVGDTDVTPYNSPSWSDGVGWILNGTQYLDTGVDDGVGATVLIRFANATNSGGGRALCGSDDQDGGILMAHYWWGNTAVFSAARRKYYTPASTATNGVWCIAGQSVYFNGLLSGTMAAGNYNVSRSLLIGATRRHSDGAVVYTPVVSIQFLGIKSSTLSGAQVLAATTAVAAL